MVDMLIASLPSAVCVLLGMILIIVEVFLPGFGLPGIGGIVLVGAGVVMVGMHFGSLTAVGTLLVIIAVLAVLISWVLRQASRGGKRSDLFLQERDELHTQQFASISAEHVNGLENCSPRFSRPSPCEVI